MSEENKNFSEKDEFEKNKELDAEMQSEQESASQTEFNSDTVYFSDTNEQDIVEEHQEEKSNSDVKKRKKRHISLKTFVISLIAVLVAAVMLTYSICSSIYQSLYAKAYVDANQNSFINGNVSTTGMSELDVIAKLIEDNYYGEVDPDKLMEAAINAYVQQTGDIYAAYYTQEELKAQQNEDLGKMTGIGVNIINSKVTYNGTEMAALKVINVIKDSPAQKIGLKFGDYIYSVVLDDGEQTVNALGYEDALNKLLGAVGTVAKFYALRKNADGYEKILFEVTRAEIITSSVYYRIPEIESNADKKVGVLKITNFDYTTPTQFTAAIEALKSSGCEKFVIDVRYNPGGYQSSVGAVLSYFLNEGDVYIRTKGKDGNIKSETIKVISDFEGDYAGCNVSEEDIGKYKDLDVTVLCNEYTASAGELFVATFKDYSLGKVIGIKTFGKGKLQSTFFLQSYALFNYGITGIDGAVKITTHEYFSAKSDSYDGIGINPDETVELCEEAKTYSIYDFENLDKTDNQLIKAINILNNKE